MFQAVLWVAEKEDRGAAFQPEVYWMRFDEKRSVMSGWLAVVLARPLSTVSRARATIMEAHLHSTSLGCDHVREALLVLAQPLSHLHDMRIAAHAQGHELVRTIGDSMAHEHGDDKLLVLDHLISLDTILSAKVRRR